MPNRSSKKPTILLNMIVKNESHIIKEALESVYKYLDYYVINDTGSTDNTREIIKEFFDSKGIKGEIVNHEFRTCKCHGKEYKKYDWFHYGWNRTYSINLCWGKSDYILFMDADDMIVGNLPIDNLTADSYSLKIGETFVHYRPHLVRNRKILGWKYVGGRHEYLTGTKHIPSVKLEGDYRYIARTMGDRSKDSKRFLNDAKIFEDLLKEEPNNDRHMFYCAQSYYDGEDFKTAIGYYEKRFKMKGFVEECYYSLYRIGLCKKLLDYPENEVVAAFLRAHKYYPRRAEPLYEIINYHRTNNRFEEAYKYKDIALKIPFPSQDVLFISKDVYDYRIIDEIALCAYYLSKFNEAAELWEKIIKENRYHENQLVRIQQNLKSAKAHLTILEETGKPKVCFYLGYTPDYINSLEISGSELLIKKISEKLIDRYDVYVFGTSFHGSVVNDVKYINCTFLNKFAEENDIDVLIISRYIHYFLEHKINAKKIFLWLYDPVFQPYWRGQELPNLGVTLYDNISYQVDGIVALSEWHKENILLYVKTEPNKIHVICDALYPLDPNDVERIPNRFVATLNNKDDIINLINNFSIIRSGLPNAELYIIDDTDAYSEANINNNYIKFLGKLKYDDLIKALRQSEYWINPISNKESYCFDALLALACGCICIGTNIGSLTNILHNRGILIDYGKGTGEKEYWNNVEEKIAFFNKNETLKKLCLSNTETWVKEQTLDNRINEWYRLFE